MAFLAGFSLAACSRGDSEFGKPTPSLKPTPPPVATVVPSPTRIAYRLAGTVAGAARMAVLEAPDGSSHLYQIGEEVPGLGRLRSVDATGAEFDGRDGIIRMNVLAARTPTERRTQFPTTIREPVDPPA